MRKPRLVYAKAPFGEPSLKMVVDFGRERLALAPPHSARFASIAFSAARASVICAPPGRLASSAIHALYTLFVPYTSSRTPVGPKFSMKASAGVSAPGPPTP